MSKPALVTIVSLWLAMGAAGREVPRVPPEPASERPSLTFSADAWDLPGDGQLGFLEIPAGPFTMGDDAHRHSIDLPRFFVGRFEVTVGQYQRFLQDEARVPSDASSVSGVRTHPVRHVSWHEAMDYAGWLTETLRHWSGTPSPLAERLRGSDGQPPWRVALPSEAEWEKAARGVDARIYALGERSAHRRPRELPRSEVAHDRAGRQLSEREEPLWPP